MMSNLEHIGRQQVAVGSHQIPFRVRFDVPGEQERNRPVGQANHQAAVVGSASHTLRQDARRRIENLQQNLAAQRHPVSVAQRNRRQLPGGQDGLPLRIQRAV